MPNNDVMQVKDRNGKVVTIFKKNLPEAIRRGGTPVGIEGKKGEGETDSRSFYEKLTDPFDPSATNPVTRALSATGATVIGTPEMVYKGIRHPVQSLDQIIDAAQSWLNTTGKPLVAGEHVVQPRPTWEGIKSVLPEALGVGAGGYLGGRLTGEVAKPVAEGAVKVAKDIPNLPPRLAQNVLGGTYEVGKAAREAAKEQATRAAEVAAQRAAKEARDVKAAAEHKAATTQELAKARARHVGESAEQVSKTKELAAKYKRELDERNRIEAENAKNEATRQVLSQRVETGTRQLTQNIKQALDNAKVNFDKEYGEFDRKILGKDEQNPHGTLKANFNPVIQSVIDARDNIISGTPENIKQFSSIIEKGEVGEAGAGKTVFPPDQTIPVADLRGYIQELEDKLYDSNLAPDVKKALDSVVKAGKGEVADAIRDVHGKSALKAYDDLNARYSDYLTDWRDTSTTNPLPKVRNKLLEGVAQRNPNYPVHLDIARTLKGANAEKAMVLLEKYRNFGADPKILSDYNKALQQLDEIPKAKKVPEVEKPKYPSAPTVAKVSFTKPPEVEPFVPRGKEPEPFDRTALMKDVLERRINAGGHIFSGFALINAIADLFRGQGGAAMSAAERVAAIQAVKTILLNPKVIEYLAKELPK